MINTLEFRVSALYQTDLNMNYFNSKISNLTAINLFLDF